MRLCLSAAEPRLERFSLSSSFFERGWWEKDEKAQGETMSANGDSAHGFELPSASASTLMTAAAIANFSQNHGQQQQQQQHLSVHSSHGRSKSKSRTSDKRASVPVSAPVTAAAAAAPPNTAAATSTATAAAAALLPARRPRHQITRSITEFSPPLRMHRHRHSHHHHPTQHALHLNAQSRKDRDRLLLLDERAPGAASAGGLGGRSSFDMTRSEYVTPSRSPDSSRRTSALVGPMIGGGENPAAVTPPSRRLRKVNNEAALVEEKGRTANRVAYVFFRDGLSSKKLGADMSVFLRIVA